MENNYMLLSRKKGPVGVVKEKVEKRKKREKRTWEKSNIEKLSDLPVFYDNYFDFSNLFMVAQKGICVFYEM